MNDRDLLRTYEPVVRYTHGELFYPCSAEDYIRNCSLWMSRPNDDPVQIQPRGTLTASSIGALEPAPLGCGYYLRFVERPLEGLELSQWFWRDDRPIINVQGRLARVGLGIRALDSLFDIALLLRGTVPGGTVAAAETQYHQIRKQNAEFPYYGRVLRQGGYVVLQYFLFYAMNDWRSTFHGVNDHEADWEQIMVFLDDSTEDLKPVWVAYAAHDFPGDILRRRWNDEELELVDNHPVVYVGAGSHASYFKSGEYLARYEVGMLKPLSNAVAALRQVWRTTLRQGDPAQIGDRIAGLLKFPYVDYARGDGFSIGPNEEQEWCPSVVHDDLPWITLYRGLWGLSTSDPFEGESAPGGPKYNRNGTVRETWANPLGWAGLHKVVPPSVAPETMRKRIEELEAELVQINESLVALQEQLPQLGLETEALERSEHLSATWMDRRHQLAEVEGELDTLYQRRLEVSEVIAANRRYLDTVLNDEDAIPGLAVEQRLEPQSSTEIRESRFVETWAAVSVGLMLLGFVAIVLLNPDRWILAGALMIAAFIAIDAAMRRSNADFLGLATTVLAVFSVGIIVYEFFFQIVLLVIVSLSLLIIIDNFREVRGR